MMNIIVARVPTHKHRGIHVSRHLDPEDSSVVIFSITTPGWILDAYIKRIPLKRGKHNEHIKKSVTEDVSSSGVHEEHNQQTEDRNSAVKYITEAALAKQRHHYARPRQAHAWNESVDHQP